MDIITGRAPPPALSRGRILFANKTHDDDDEMMMIHETSSYPCPPSPPAQSARRHPVRAAPRRATPAPVIARGTKGGQKP